jgi:hypothetical protein
VNRGAAVVVVAAFAASLVVTVAVPACDDDASAASFAAAASAHADVVRPGDRVLVHPPWRDDVVDAVAAVVPGHLVTEAFAPRHGEAWPALVVIADRRWPLPRAIADRAGDPVATDGAIALYRVAASGGGDGAFDLAGASVYVDDAVAGRVACPWSAARGRHVCAGLPEWMTVGDDTLTIDGAATRCTWSHPRTGATLVIDYGLVDVDGVVSLDVALSDGAVANARGAAVTAALFVDDDEARVTVQRQRGFHSARVDVGDPRQARLRLQFTTPDDGQRHTCFRLRTGR